MAPEAALNDLTPAQKLQEKHMNDAAHLMTVEDTVDEEAPLSLLAESEVGSAVVLPPADEPSETALGKQKAREEPNGAHTASKPKSKAVFDPLSEELFPSLGGASKPQAPVAAKAWGVKKPVPVAQAYLNGVNGSTGNGHLTTPASSRASTPPTGTWPPNSGHGAPLSQSRGSINHRLAIPGKCTERIRFAPTQLKPRNELRKPIPEVLRSINKKSKANLEMKPGPQGVLIFEATGPVDAVRQALLETAKEIGSKQSVKIPIPLSVRSHIIGPRGTVIQGISQRTGARIQIPKNEELSLPNLDDDESITIDVVIEGDAVAAEWARREIEGIVNERTSIVAMRLRDIPAEFFPFIAGPHNAGIIALENGGQLKVEIPHYYTWSQQPPPQPPSSGALPQFLPDTNKHIKISGDRLAAQQARAEIERQVEQLRDQITLSPLAITRGQHQFMLGENGSLLHDFLDETGCAVILPPTSDDTEFVYVTGPQPKIDLGIEKAINLATVMQMSSVDISRQHANAPMGPHAHARALTRYLQQRRAIEQLEKQYDLRIVLPTAHEGSMNWEVYSRDGKNTIRARSDILNMINAYPPARIRHVNADPFYHQHLHKRGAKVIRDDFGVHLLRLGEKDQKPEVVLIYEGIGLLQEEYQLPKQRPTASELAEFEKLLDKAQAHILSLIQDKEELDTASVEVLPKFHEKVRKFVDSEQKSLPTSEIPVQITFGPGGGVNGSTAYPQTPAATVTIGHEVYLRGPCSAVHVLREKILGFVEEEKQNELERGHVTKFDFPQKYANFLIGRKGENINKYREDFDVDIQVNDGKVEIKGPKAKADLAKSRILSLCRKLEDEATHIIKIKPQYHRDLIGAKGSQVNRLQLRYNVRIQFPRTAHIVGDDRSVADGASDVGSSRRANQAPDEVIVRGPKKGAEEARDELLSLLQWTIDNSFSSTVSVAQSQLPSLIGQGGREMENIRLSTGAQIDVPGRDAADSSGRAQIQIKGTKKQVEEAKTLLEQKAKVFDDSITKSIEVDKKYHKALIGSGGSNIRRIINEAGGSDDHRESSRLVRYRFPTQDSPDKQLRLEGNRAVVEKIILSIQTFVNQRDSQTSQVIEVAPEKHRLLIGHGGEARRNLESRFKVNIDIPKMSQQGPARSQIKIEGLPKDVEQASAHILALVKDQEGETVQVPRRIHHLISGPLFPRLRHDYKVTVDHAGQHPPPKPTGSTRSQIQVTGPPPLITDEHESMDNHSWEVVDSNVESKEEGDIPWVLRGSSENIAKARAALEKAVQQAQAQQHSVTGYLVLSDPRTYRFIVGPAGSQISSIRKQTGCKIQVPRTQAKGEAIEIVGSKNGVEHAKEIILDVVQNGGNGGNGVRRE